MRPCAHVTSQACEGGRGRLMGSWRKRVCFLQGAICVGQEACSPCPGPRRAHRSPEPPPAALCADNLFPDCQADGAAGAGAGHTGLCRAPGAVIPAGWARPRTCRRRRCSWQRALCGRVRGAGRSAGQCGRGFWAPVRRRDRIRTGPWRSLDAAGSGGGRGWGLGASRRLANGLAAGHGASLSLGPIQSLAQPRPVPGPGPCQGRCGLVGGHGANIPLRPLWS